LFLKVDYIIFSLKIFEWLNSLSIGQIVANILPVLIHSIIVQLLDEAKPLLDNSELNLNKNFEDLIEKSIIVTRDLNGLTKYEVSKNLNFTFFSNLIKNLLKDLVNSIESIENILARFKLLKKKFAIDNDKSNEFLVQCLIASFNHTEVKIKQGSRSESAKLVIKFVENMASRNAENTIEKPASFIDALNGPCKREYIIRSSCSRPAPYSRQSPQKMYCLVKNNEFRLAGAFTEDTMFV
jgi:Rab3 GTPase-activating protein catalytic subunit